MSEVTKEWLEGWVTKTVLVPMQAGFESVDKRFDLVDKRLEGIDERLEIVDQRLETIDKRLDGHDRRMDSHDSRMDRLEQQIKDLAIATKDGFETLGEQLDIKIRRLEKVLESETAVTRARLHRVEAHLGLS